MNCTQEYKKKRCIKMMSEEYKEKFCKIVEVYASDLNRGNVKNTTVFTLHDFDNHCMDIYFIISDIILNEKVSTSNALTDFELYLLNLAVLFHDISMSTNIRWNREKHSVESAEYVQKIYNDKESVFGKQCGLTPADIKVLKLIIIAHSDVKDGTVISENNGLNNPRLKESFLTRAGEVRVKLLAGILRLADELDVTSFRLGNNNIECQLDSEESTDSEKVSLEHWRKLHLFSEIKRGKKANEILLVVDDEYVEDQILDGNYQNIIAKLNSISSKIECELEKISSNIFDVCARGFIAINTLKIITDNCEMKKYLEEKTDVGRLEIKESKTHDYEIELETGVEEKKKSH